MRLHRYRDAIHGRGDPPQAWGIPPGYRRASLVSGQFSPADVKAGLDALSTGAEFVLGHNVKRHDLPVLAQLFPGLTLSQLPVIDTLELSPLAFPEILTIGWSRTTSWSAMRETTRSGMQS